MKVCGEHYLQVVEKITANVADYDDDTESYVDEAELEGEAPAPRYAPPDVNSNEHLDDLIAEYCVGNDGQDSDASHWL